MYAQVSPVAIQTPTHRNMIARNMTALPLVSSPSGILPPPSSHCAVILQNITRCAVKKTLLFNFFAYSKFCKSEIAKLDIV